MKSFQLLSQEDEMLTSGSLRKEVFQCIEENEESYEFENREYLIMVERESLSSRIKLLQIFKIELPIPVN